MVALNQKEHNNMADTFKMLEPALATTGRTKGVNGQAAPPTVTIEGQDINLIPAPIPKVLG
jgi:hypothetical protein